MPRISAFSPQEKLCAISRYRQGGCSLVKIARELGVDCQTIRNWIRLYETFGIDGLKGINPQTYDPEFKKSAVETYLTGLYSQKVKCIILNLFPTARA